MRATFTEEQEALASTARDLARPGLAAAREALDGGEPAKEPTASLMAGFSGLAVREEAGGSGGGLVDLAIVLEALGETVTPTPWVAHVLALQVADSAGIDVADAAAGTTRLALAVEEDGTAHGEWTTRLDGGRIRGAKTAVRDAEGADALVVVCADGVVARTTRFDPHARTPLDPTRGLASVQLDDAEVDGHGTAPDGLARAILGVAAGLVGVGRGAVALGVEYAKVREQFGQPIGRFQGVAHQLAEAWTDVELAWSLVLYAAWALDDASEDARRSVHAAKDAAGSAAIHAAERCTQVHGGIGMTWEADPHLYLRRAVSDDAWLGAARVHRRLVGDDLVGAGP